MHMYIFVAFCLYFCTFLSDSTYCNQKVNMYGCVSAVIVCGNLISSPFGLIISKQYSHF